jgi:hypothetical protein
MQPYREPGTDVESTACSMRGCPPAWRPTDVMCIEGGSFSHCHPHPRTWWPPPASISYDGRRVRGMKVCREPGTDVRAAAYPAWGTSCPAPAHTRGWQVSVHASLAHWHSHPRTRRPPELKCDGRRVMVVVACRESGNHVMITLHYKQSTSMEQTELMRRLSLLCH